MKIKKFLKHAYWFWGLVFGIIYTFTFSYVALLLTYIVPSSSFSFLLKLNNIMSSNFINDWYFIKLPIFFMVIFEFIFRSWNKYKKTIFKKQKNVYFSIFLISFLIFLTITFGFYLYLVAVW